MLRGLPASLIFHGAVIFGGSVAWPYIAPEREIVELVPVTLDVQLDIATNLAPIIRREAEPDIPEPEPEEEIIEDEAPEDEGEDAELSEDEIDTTDVRELPQDIAPEEESAEVSEDAEKPEDEPEDEKEEEKIEPQRRDPDDLESILGDASALFSEQDQSRRTPPKKPKEIKLTDEKKAEPPRKGAGDRSKETARVEAMIASKMRVCWDDVIDLPNPERLNVEIRMRLNTDGSLAGDVELIKPRRAPIGDRPMGIAVERALKAARKCAPYKLPKDAQSSYDGGWDVVNFRIGPGFGQ